MVIFKVVNLDNKKVYYDVSLNGYNFAKKIRHILYGYNDVYKHYYPLSQDIGKGHYFQVIICDFNVPPQEINTRMTELVSSDKNSYERFWQPLVTRTIEKHYRKIVEPTDTILFYNELVAAFGETKLITIIYDFIYQHCSEQWLFNIFDLEQRELDLILDYLPFYIYMINFNRAVPHFVADFKPAWKRGKNGVYCVSRG